MSKSSHKTRSIPLSKPWLDEAEVQASRRPIVSAWVTQGPEVAAFEQEFATLVGTPFACAVSSCTGALHLALLAVGVRPGDEVICPSLTWCSTANVALYLGAKPVFCDALVLQVIRFGNLMVNGKSDCLQ